VPYIRYRYRTPSANALPSALRYFGGIQDDFPHPPLSAYQAFHYNSFFLSQNNKNTFSISFHNPLITKPKSSETTSCPVHYIASANNKSKAARI
jgi:hypothetical protein